MEAVLKVTHVNKSFNGLKVLTDVSFSLPKGTITSLFGENGSGKTTLFHIISGFLKADHGIVAFNTENLNGKPAVEVARKGIGRVWQSPRIFRNISVMDNLLLASKDHPGEKVANYLWQPLNIWREEKKRKAIATDISKEVGLDGKLQKTAGALSFGQQKLLSIGMLLMYDSALLLLDEPFAGVNAKMVNEISDVLLSLKNKGKTVFLVEHNRVKANSISDKVLLLVKGKAHEQETGND